MEKKLQKIYLTYINMYYSLLKVQDLWQVPYLANNLSEGIHRIKQKFGRNDKKYEICGIKYKYCDCFLEYKIFKNDLIEYRCLV